MSAIRVLVVDDSAFMRRQLRLLLETDPMLSVIDVARDGKEALAKVKTLRPDVVTMDVNMPVMDGLTALTYIMLEQPTPVIMVSSITEEGALATFEALELGAVDFVSKGSGTVSLDIDEQADELITKIKAAAGARLNSSKVRQSSRVSRPRIAPAPAPRVESGVVVIGVSTGGPKTLLDILPILPESFPLPIVLVQHMPASFTASFAQHLDQACQLRVKEAQQGEQPVPGRVYVAPGGFQLTFRPSGLHPGAGFHLTARSNGYAFCPSVDVLFESAAKVYRQRALGVLLTGMGEDGAQGLLQIRQAGGITLAESEETAVVFGMPQAAIRRGAVERVAPAYAMATEIQTAVRRMIL